MMEYWNIGIMGIKFGKIYFYILAFSLRTIPAFHYSAKASLRAQYS